MKITFDLENGSSILATPETLSLNTDGKVVVISFNGINLLQFNGVTVVKAEPKSTENL